MTVQPTHVFMVDTSDPDLGELILIVPKEYWDTEQALWDDDLEPPIEQFLEQNGIFQVAESTYEVDLGVTTVVAALALLSADPRFVQVAIPSDW